jgi:cytochrome c-type biogenesis protein CcmH
VATESNAPPSEQQIVEMVAQLAERLKKEPDNVEGWFILARSYYAMGRYAESAAAFERLDTLRPNDPDILADLADALAMNRSRDISGPPLALVERALKLDPKQGKALAIAGTAAFDRQDYAAAVSYWERLVATQAPGSDIAKTVQASIDEARSRGKLPAPVARISPQPSTAGVEAKGKSAAVSGTVTLSPSLASRAAPTDTVFVYARAAEGGRMPLAILRAQVKDLPLAFKLDDTLSMSPSARISGVKDVVVTARISRTGSATPQSGDLEGASGAVSVGTEALKIAIDRALP